MTIDFKATIAVATTKALGVKSKKPGLEPGFS